MVLVEVLKVVLLVVLLEEEVKMVELKVVEREAEQV